MRLVFNKAAVVAFLLASLGSAFAQTTLPPEIERGRDWLTSQVGNDGRLNAASLQLATETQSEAESIETLQHLGAAPVALVNRHAARSQDAGVEHLSRRIIALARARKPVESLLTELRAFQNADGGFGGSAAHLSSVLDTSFALVAFRVAGVGEGQDIQRAVTYLVARVGTGDSDWAMTAQSRPFVSAYALLALQMHSARYPIAATLTAQRDALIAQQGNGVYAEVLLDTVAALALQYSSTGETGLTALKSSIRAAQLPDGSWQGDSFLTALALRVLASEVIAPPSTDGKIVLRVRDAVTLNFLAGARLTLAQRPDLDQLVSAQDGRIDSGDLLPGAYALSLGKNGYRARDLGVVQIVAGQTRDLGIVDLGRDLNTAVLFGRVTDVSTTAPLAGVDIQVTGAVQASTQTAPDGSFELLFQSAGDIQVSASRSGYQTVNGTGTLVLGQSLRFSPALYPDGGAVPTSASLTALVVNALTDVPVSGARLQLGAASATSDGNGRVQLSELSAGTFSASIDKIGYLTAQVSGSLVPGVNDAGVIRLMPESTATLSTLNGRVTDAANGVAIAGATVAINGTNLRATSDASGRYSIANIATLPFIATATAPGYGTQQVSAGADLHANFQADFALQKLANANVALESVVMSAPEYDPFVEVGVLGTVRNLSDAQEVGLIFSAIVSDSEGRILRDVPYIAITADRTFDDTIVRFQPGEAKPITIIWGSFNDAPGDYSVLFRGAMPDGRVAVEGSSSYRVRALRQIGGGIALDPPIVQAGTGQAVAIEADVTNLGNQVIPAGDVRMQITLVAKDDRPPLPPKPTFGANLISGSPLNRPVGITRDGIGNVYTLNTNGTTQLIKVTAAGAGSVVRALPTKSSTNVTLSTPLDLSWRQPNLIRVAWITGWVADIDLDNSAAVQDFKAPPTGLSNLTAYAFDPATGHEYFGGTYESRPRVLRRDASGVVTILVDAGLNDARASVIGSDNKLYVVNFDPGAVFRIDPATSSIEPFWIGLGRPLAMAVDAAGTLFVAESNPQRISRRRADGTIDVFASGFGVNLVDLKFGLDGALHGLSNDGSIRRFASDGSHTVWARSILSTVSGVAIESGGGFIAHQGTQIRYRASDGSIAAIGNGFVTVQDLIAGEAPGEPVYISTGGLYRAQGGNSQTLVTPAGVSLAALSRAAGGYLIGGSEVATPGVYDTDGSSWNTRLQSPLSTALHRVLALPDGKALVVNSDSLVEVDASGATRRIAKFANVTAVALSRSGDALWLNSTTEGLLRIDLVTGAKLRLRASIAVMQYAFADDGNGGLIYGDYSGRKLMRYDTVANTIVEHHVMATNIYPQQVAIAPDGTLLVRFWDASLRRLDGSTWTTVDTSVTELAIAADFRVGYRKNEKFYRAPLTVGATPTLVAVLVSTPTLGAWIDDATLYGYYSNGTRLQRFNAAGVKQSETLGFSSIRSLAELANGDVYLLDNQLDLHLVHAGELQRVGRYATVLRIRANANDLLLSMGDGIHRLNANATTTRLLTVPGWSANQYNAFGVSDGQTVLSNSSTHEIVVMEGATPTARFLPFANPTAFAQRADGAWWIGTPGRIALIDADGRQSRAYSAQGAIADLLRHPDGRLLAVTSDQTVKSISESGVATIITGLLNGGSTRLNSLAVGSGDLFAVSSTGSAYQDELGALKHIVSGVPSVSGLHLRPNGGLVITSMSSTALLEYRNGTNTVIGHMFDGVGSVCSLNSGTLAVAGGTYLSVMEMSGSRFSFSTWPTSLSARGIACGTAGEILIVNYAQNAIRRATSGVPETGLEVGTVVREQIVPLAELGLEGNLHLSFDSWLPSEGGDYEVSIVPIDPSVAGRLLTGIHVGPTAHASMTVAPNSVVPGEASVQIDTNLQGADFTRLARVNRAQLQLVGDTVYADAMSLDPSGHLWYRPRGGSAIYRMPVTGGTAVRVGTFTTTDFKGELPIDSLGRAFFVSLVSSKYVLRRTDSSGAFVQITDFGNVRVNSMSIDEQDRIYVLTQDNKIHLVQPDGSKAEYVTLPNTQAPYGMTRDGAGGLYVQQQGERVLYVSPEEREVTLLTLDGVDFEYEGVNIAGDCSESMFMTLMRLNGTSASGGEEHTVVQLNGRTGEFGTIINGKVVSDDMTDMDFITYDRFGSRLLIMSENYSNGKKLLFTVPVTCGAIDMDLHLVLPAGQPFLSSDPAVSSFSARDNGDIEYVWNLRDVNKQGMTVKLYSKLVDLVRMEDRPAVKEAFVMLKNSFQPEPVRIDIAIPTVHVRDLVDIAVTLDREEYPQQTAVGILVPMNNLDNVAKSGLLQVRVEDAAGLLVETLIERQQPFGPLERIELTPPFNTGVLRVGDYRVVAEIKDDLGGVVARAEDQFRVIAGDGDGPLLTSTVATDKPVYLIGENATIFANVRNLSANLGFSNLAVSERVSAIDGSVIFDGSQPLANLEQGAEARLNFGLSLAGVAAGFYDVHQEVRDAASNELLDARTTRFEVRSIGGVSALTGTLALDPIRVRRGQPLAIAATLRNRGDLAMTGVESVLRVIVPDSNTVLAEWTATHDLAVGAEVPLAQQFDTGGRALRDYLVVLSARVGGEERPLAQKPFWIEDVVFVGEISATPEAIAQGGDVRLAGAVRNSGNFRARDSVVTLAVFDATTNVQMREWQYPADIAAGGVHAVLEDLNTLPLPIGTYQARLSVSFEDATHALAQDSFEVLNYRISGVFEADPEQVERGEPVALRGTVFNTGNLGIDPLPLRIEVFKVDTQARVLSLDDSTALAAQAQYPMTRSGDTTAFAIGHYEGVFSAFFAGAWHVLATDRFEVVRSVEVDISMDVPRDARVLVLMSCSQHQAQQNGNSGGHAQTVCEQQRQAFLSQYLSERGIEHKIVLDQDSFMRELRCGRYNVFWFSGGAVKLGVAEALEVRESIYRGDGFIVEGDNDQRNSQFDVMLGGNFRGHHAGSDFPVTGTASLFPAVTVPSYGRALKLELTTGTLQARFASLNAPAIISAGYGQGRALSYAFDLIESLRQDGDEPASERLMLNGLVHVAPLTAPAAYAVGSYVPVTTTVQNLGVEFDARLETAVDAPTAIVSSSPQATEGDVQRSAWHFSLAEGEQRSFDVNLITGAANPIPVRSQIFERAANGLMLLGNAQVELATQDAAAATQALLDGLRNAVLHGGEAAARNRALTAIEAARTAEAAGNTAEAIDRWLKASDEVQRITTISHAEWRLAIARLLAVSQHRGCDAAIRLCGTQPGAPVAFDAAAFDLSQRIGRVQSGGSSHWEWQLADRSAAAPALRADLDWRKNQAVNFLLEIDAAGIGQLELRQGGVLKSTLRTNPGVDGILPRGDAVQLVARNSPDAGNARVRLSALKLNGQSLATTLASSTNGVFAESRLSLFAPSLRTALRLEGTVQMDYSGNTLPEGSRLELDFLSGDLQCNGGVQ